MKAKVISVQFTDVLQVSTTAPPATKLVLKATDDPVFISENSTLSHPQIERLGLALIYFWLCAHHIKPTVNSLDFL